MCLSAVQCWAEAAKSGQRGNDSTLAAVAMYVVQVTQANGLWASEHDTAFIRYKLLKDWCMQHISNPPMPERCVKCAS